MWILLPPLFNSKPLLWTQVPHLGRGLEPWYCRRSIRKRPQRNLWKDRPHRVWRGSKLNVGDELIMWHIFTALTPIVEQPQEKSSLFSGTPMPRGKCLFPESHNSTDLSSTLHQSISNETVRLERFVIFFFKLSEVYCSNSSVLFCRSLPTFHTWLTSHTLRFKWTKLTPVTPTWATAWRFGQW